MVIRIYCYGDEMYVAVVMKYLLLWRYIAWLLWKRDGVTITL